MTFSDATTFSCTLADQWQEQVVNLYDLPKLRSNYLRAERDVDCAGHQPALGDAGPDLRVAGDDERGALLSRVATTVFLHSLVQTGQSGATGMGSCRNRRETHSAGQWKSSRSAVATRFKS